MNALGATRCLVGRVGVQPRAVSSHHRSYHSCAQHCLCKKAAVWTRLPVAEIGGLACYSVLRGFVDTRTERQSRQHLMESRVSDLTHMFPEFALAFEFDFFVTSEITLRDYAYHMIVDDNRQMLKTAVPHHA